MARQHEHKRGPVPKLTEEQQRDIYKWICKLPPWRYRLKDHLWDQENVLRLVKGKCNIELSARTVNAYLRKWGFIADVGINLSLAKCTKAIQSWREDNFAEVRRHAVEEGASICLLSAPIDLSLGDSSQASASSRRMMSVVTGDGLLRWRVVRGNFTLERKRKFINAIAHDEQYKKLFLIRPNWTTYPCEQDGALQAACDVPIRIFPERREQVHID